MKKVFLSIALVMSMVAGIQAQTLTKDAVLVGGDGDKITLGAPASVDAQKLLLPGTLGSAGSLLYISGVAAGPIGSTAWLAPGSDGDVLTLSGGVPTWSASPALNFWGLSGNGHTVTDNTNNLLGTTTANPLRIITGSGGPNTRILISATGDVTVNGTAGTTNVSMTSLGAATGTTGRVMFATDVTGAVNALAVPASNGQVLTSTTGGVLSWSSSPTLNYWDLAGNGHTVVDGTNNLLGTTTAAPLQIITGGTTRITLSSAGDVLVAGTAGTPNLRATSLTTASASSTGGVLFADATGYISRLAVPASNGQVLTSTTGGALTWTTPGASSNWTLTGNSGTTAGTNFIGTTDAVDFVVKTGGNAASNERVRVDAGGQVGIGNITPNVMMDIKGGLATRSSDYTLTVSGNNNNIVIGDSSFVRTVGTAVDPTITGIANGYDGKMLTIFNTSSTQNLTFAHENTNSTDVNRIRNSIGQGGNVTIQDSGSVDLIYDGPGQRWNITNVRGAVSAVSSGFTYFARTTVDTTITTTAALTPAAELKLNILPHIVHTIDGVFYLTSPSSSPEVAFSFDVPGDFALMKITVIGFGDGGANVVRGSDILEGDNAASGDITVTGGAGNGTFVMVHGIYINGPTAGNFTVNWQRASGSTDLTLKEGSYIRLIPVGTE